MTLETIRADIVSKSAEIVAHGTIDRAQPLASSDIEDALARATEEAQRRFGHAVGAGPVHRAFRLGDSLDSVLPILVQVLGAQAVRDALAPRVASLPTLQAAQTHATAKAALEAQLLALEIDEELEIRRREALGETVIRRPEARPEIVSAQNLGG